MYGLGETLYLTADYDSAQEASVEARHAFEAIDGQTGVTDCIQGLELISEATGQAEEARALFMEAKER